MEKSKYQALVKKHTPKEESFHNALIALITGGLMGVLGEFLVQAYAYYLQVPRADAAIFMIITLIFIGCLLTCLGFFDKWVDFCRCGLIIPITGFAHSMQSEALEYKKEGFIMGLGANMFKLAGSVIIYGVISAYVFGLLRMLIMGG